MTDDRPPCRLYLITPPRIEDPVAFRDQVAAALDGGDVACLQLRLKQGDGIDEAMTERVADAVMALAQERDVAVVINDSPALALKLGADGVHVGWHDVPVREARQVLGPDAIVGATAKNSYHAAMEAGDAGADYVAFGAFFATSTKTATVSADVQLLADWQAMTELPCVAIGGITPENGGALVSAGADFLAVSSAVWRHGDGPGAAVAAFNALFAEASGTGAG
ncbi:MAG: thiamine phosphate synthase [Pseudomonadota bacterium]